MSTILSDLCPGVFTEVFPGGQAAPVGHEQPAPALSAGRVQGEGQRSPGWQVEAIGHQAAFVAKAGPFGHQVFFDRQPALEKEGIPTSGRVGCFARI